MANILVIDDNPENREILKARLEQAGHHVVEAKDGDEGVGLCKDPKPDLIFLDVMMPKVDGWQVCRQLKANPLTRNIPVVMLTALGQKIDQLRGFESGADEFLTKPWDAQHLLEIVRTLCPAAGIVKE